MGGKLKADVNCLCFTLVLEKILPLPFQVVVGDLWSFIYLQNSKITSIWDISS